ncbi:MAG: YciI family protein [Parvularculaceae bacterium]
MKIMLLAAEAPQDFALREQPDKFDGYMGAWYAFSEGLTNAGLLKDAAALQPPSSATVVSVRNGVRKVEDGPFPDTKEQLGGFFIIEEEDVAKAAEWAKKCPAAKYGFVDVRVVPDYGQGE